MKYSNPPVVFLDEPSTGMDPMARRHMWEFIRETMHGRCVVLTTHSGRRRGHGHGRAGDPLLHDRRRTPTWRRRRRPRRFRWLLGCDVAETAGAVMPVPEGLQGVYDCQVGADYASLVISVHRAAGAGRAV